MTDNRVEDYKDLIVWKRSMELSTVVYAIAKKLPKIETFALADQIRRSAVSIPSNIAEGYGRTTSKEYARFLSIARGSVYELETQLILCVRLEYLEESDLAYALSLSNEIIKMLNVIIPKVMKLEQQTIP